MNEPVPVAVIGCGHLGTFHARLYRNLPGARLVAVMDIVPEKAQTLGEALGVPWTTDLAKTLSEARAVSVATPTTTHRAVAEACLRAGCAVLVEKPLAATVEDGAALVGLAAARGLPLAVGHVERFNPAFRAARERIGRPRFIESHRLSTFVPRSLDVDVVLDLMIHDLDLTLGLIPAEVESCDAIGVPVLTSGEDIANARIRFADGAVANFTASRVSRERVRKIRFFGERRYLSIDLMERTVEQVALKAMPTGVAGAMAGGSLAGGALIGGALTGGSLAGSAPVRGATADRASAGSAPAGHAALGTAPPGHAPTAEDRALLAYLADRRLLLEHGPIPVPEANPLEDELIDFLGALEGKPTSGATGEDGLRCLEVALEIHRRVQESLRRLGLEKPPPGA